MLIMRVRSHHRSHRLSIVLLVAMMWAHVRAPVWNIVLPLVGRYWHLLPGRDTVRIHDGPGIVGKSLLELLHHERRVGLIWGNCDCCDFISAGDVDPTSVSKAHGDAQAITLTR